MKITVKQEGQKDRELTGHSGQTIFSFLANQGIRLDAPCAGRGRCGKCLVKAHGELSPPEANEAAVPEGHRLACLARLEGPATVEIPKAASFSSVKGLGESVPYTINSPLRQTFFPPADRLDTTDYMSLLGAQTASLVALNQLAAIDVKRQGGRAIFWGDELLGVRQRPDKDSPLSALPEEKLLAAAVDLGTTGLGVAIIDVLKGEVIAQGTTLNPQTTCGGDVISRITMAAEGPEKLDHLQSLVLDGIGDLIKQLTSEEDRANLMATVISGNTTMLFLLAAVQPAGLAQAPYRPVFTKALDLSHFASRLALPAGAKVFTTPSISAYVGGDITSGMLAVGLKERPGTVLFIDIGTNGEIVLSHQGRLVATSCAAGPALEGMNIINGQRATPGAVDSFRLGENYQIHYSTIGEAAPTGICGSGLIDLTGVLVTAGLIDATGRMKTPKDLPNDAPSWLKELDNGRLTFAGEVYFDQKDIRQVQLAKGAIAAAVEMLLARFELTEDNLDEIIIAGAFGFHLSPENLQAIGLIPRAYKGPIRFVGNSSLAGAARFLLNEKAPAELAALGAETEVLELGQDPQFQTIFLRHLGF